MDVLVNKSDTATELARLTDGMPVTALSGVNYFFGRVASFKDVTEELIVVQLLAWAGAGKVTISAGQCGHGRWLAVEARHRETTGHKQGEL